MSEIQIAASDPLCNDNALRQRLCLALPPRFFSPTRLAELIQMNVITLKIDDSSPNFKRRHFGMLYLRGQQPKYISIDVDNQTSTNLVKFAQMNATLALTGIDCASLNATQSLITFGGFKLIEPPNAAEYHLLLLFPFSGNMPPEFTDPSSVHLIDDLTRERCSYIGQTLRTDIIECFDNDKIHTSVEQLSICLTIMLNDNTLDCCSNKTNSKHDEQNISTHLSWKKVLNFLISHHSNYELQRTSPKSGHSCLFKDACPFIIFPNCVRYGSTPPHETRLWIFNWANGINGIILNFNT